MTITFD